MAIPLVLTCVVCGENMILESIQDEIGEPICNNCAINSDFLEELDSDNVLESNIYDIWN